MSLSASGYNDERKLRRPAPQKYGYKGYETQMGIHPTATNAGASVWHHEDYTERIGKIAIADYEQKSARI